MSSAKDKVSSGVTAVTDQGLVAHLLRMIRHYGKVHAKLHAGAITFFAFLSLFPLLALVFFAVGVIATVYPDADAQIESAIQGAFPGLIGGDAGISLDQVRTLGGSGVTALVGFGGVLFTGLAFIQVLRLALMYVFERPIPQDNFVKAMIKDLLGLLTVGGTLLLSVLVGSVLTRYSTELLQLLQIDEVFSGLVGAVGLAVGLLANIALFFVMFRQLAQPDAPPRALLGGALLGALGFEVLKQTSTILIGLTEGNPAFQAFGIALVLVVVLNYFARLALYAASWAHTSQRAMASRSDPTALVQGPQLPDLGRPHVEEQKQRSAVARWAAPFAAGSATMLGLVAALRKRDDG